MQNKDLRQTNDAQIAPIVQRQKRQNAKKSAWSICPLPSKPAILNLKASPAIRCGWAFTPLEHCLQTCKAMLWNLQSNALAPVKQCSASYRPMLRRVQSNGS